jgi:hypothetical protein
MKSANLKAIVRTGTKAQALAAIRAATLDDLKQVFGSLEKADAFVKQLENLCVS